METENIEIKQLNEQTLNFMESCLKIESLDSFSKGLEDLLTTENLVSKKVKQLEEEQDYVKLLEWQQKLKKWEEANKEYLSACVMVYQELKRMEKEYIFVIDTQDIIILIKAITTYNALKHQLLSDPQKEPEQQVSQLHKLQNKINQKYKNVFPNSTDLLLIEELPRVMNAKETKEEYQKYLNDFYKKPEEVTIDAILDQVEVTGIPAEEPVQEQSEPTQTKEETPEFTVDPITPIAPVTPVILEKTDAEQREEFMKSVSGKISQEPVEQKPTDVITKTIEKRRENYNAYRKLLYNEMDQFEQARKEIQLASESNSKITDYLQNQYNTRLDLQEIVTAEIQRITKLEDAINDPNINLNIPNLDMPRETVLEYLKNGWPFDYNSMDRIKGMLPIPKKKDHVPEPQQETQIAVDLPQEDSYNEEVDLSRYPFYTKIYLHENARLWGIKGALENAPIPAKYPFDAERYALGYSVLKPDKTFQVAHDEKTLESLLNQGGIVVAVRTFDGFYDLNDINFAKNLIR